MRVELREATHGDYSLSTDHDRLDFAVIHHWLSTESYWAKGRAREVVELSWTNTALVGGAYTPEGELVAFARMVTDAATFGWLCDVFVVPEHRGTGAGVAVVELIVDHPAVKDIKRQLLATNDAHELYRRFGYVELKEAEKWMIRPDVAV